MDETTYPSFLSSLDEPQLIAHINTLSQFTKTGENAILGQKDGQTYGEIEDPNKPSFEKRDSVGEVFSGTFVTSTPGPAKNRKLIGTRTTSATNTTNTISNTTKARHPFLCSASSLTSDPFNDNLDSQLLRLGNGAGQAPVSALNSGSSLTSDGPIPGNQLAYLKDGKSTETHIRPAKRSFSKTSSFGGAEQDFQSHSRDGIRGNYGEGYGDAEPEIDQYTDQDEASDGETDAEIPGNGHNPAPPISVYGHPEPASETPNDTRVPEKEPQSPNAISDAENDTSAFADVGPQHAFGDFDTYFQNKYRKQQVSDRDFIRWEKQRRVANGQSADIPPVFAGCKIYVNGNTTPTLATIHKLVILHGGIFLGYLQNKGAATHIICDRLTPRKKIEYRNYRVVRAQWIADCVTKERLLDWKVYRLIDDVAPLQKRLGFSRVGDASGDENAGEGGGGGSIHGEKETLEGICEDVDFGELAGDETDGFGGREEGGIEYGFPGSDGVMGKEMSEGGDLGEPMMEDVQDELETLGGPIGGDQDNCENSDAISKDSQGDFEEFDAPIEEDGLRHVDTSIVENIPDNLEGLYEPFPENMDNIEHEPAPFGPHLPKLPHDHDLPPTAETETRKSLENPFLEPEPNFQNLPIIPNIPNPHKPTAPTFSQLNVSKPRQPFAQMDAKHPDFLAHFFANSRLHHLSTWKADLKSKFLRLIAKGYEGPAPVPDARPVILHIDFDCFFATASALQHPHLDISKDPIAVSHGGKSSDVASCNYVARTHGISNGMWLGRALEMCPQLRVVDYDFESYERFSHAFYSYLVTRKIFDSILPVSIDEVLVDATSHCHGEDVVANVEELCSQIRRDVFALTKCAVSIGAGPNVLLAKLAIRKAKPDGHFYLHENIQDFLDSTDVRQVPGIGRSLAARLSDELGRSERGPILIKEVRGLSSERLVRVFGEKTGLKIYENCRGRDSTSIRLDLNSSDALLGRKTVSVDVNYGIRFDLFSEAEAFLMSLAKELHSRLVDLGLCGSSITLRLARRAPDAPVITPKFLGLGKCVFVSRSSSLGVATSDWGMLGSEMKALFRSLNVPPRELRGIAVSLSKLEDIDVVKKQRQQKLAFTRRASERIPVIHSQDMPFAERVTGTESVDWEVFNQLPEEIKRELKKELLRRGIPVSVKERSPSKMKADPGAKVYLQQMFPTQPYGEFKVKRVVESPTKRRKADSPKKAVSPTRAPYNDTVSYDEDVLNEIPSSIRNEFMEELEWQKKHKSLGFVSMKAQMERKQHLQRQFREQVIDEKWLSAQPRALTLSAFAGIYNYHDMVSQLRQWVSSTTRDEGPHLDDVAMFENHLSEVLNKGCTARVLNLLKIVETEVELQQSIVRVCSQPDEKMARGVEDWRSHIARMRAAVQRGCDERGMLI